MHEIKEWSQNFGADAALDNIHKQPPRTIHGLIMVPTYNHGCRSLFTNKTGLQIQVWIIPTSFDANSLYRCFKLER